MKLMQQIEKLRKERGLSKAEMARRFGVENQNYNNWTYRNSLPKEFYEVGIRMLHELDPSNASEVRDPATIYVAEKRVPLISSISAGEWCEAEDPFEPGDAEDWLPPCPRNHSSTTYALRVEGDSMETKVGGEKSYPPGTIIYVDPERQWEVGNRVIAKIPGVEKAVFKTLVEDAGVYYLQPINPQYPTVALPEGARICGVVIGSYRDE